MTSVLIVDDLPDRRRLLRALLEDQAWDVVEASNGAHALAQARRHPPDLIVSNLLMPAIV